MLIRRVWSKIWQTALPSQIKVFGWGLCHEALVVYGQLRKRKISVKPQCPRCKQEEETVIHAIRDCEYAREAWRLSSGQTWLRESLTGVFDWFIHATEKMELQSFEKGLTLM